MTTHSCKPRSLNAEQTALARRRMIEVNPANLLEQREIERTPPGRRGGERRLAVVIGKKWPKAGVQLAVQFMDTPPLALRKRILLHMNAWSRTANVRFRESREPGEVRIARLDSPLDMAGYWSYVGTDILGVEADQPTLNLEGFTMRTSEAEFRRVVRHEAGHTLGFEHEHLRSDLVKRIDKRKAIAYFDLTDGWTPEETMEQVLTPLARASLMGTTESDPHSIMCYQIPAQITKNGKAIPGGRDINARDFAFAAEIYPLPKPSRDTGERDPAPPPALKPTAGSGLVAPRKSVVTGDVFNLVVLDPFQRDTGEANDSRESSNYLRVLASYGGARVSADMRIRAEPGEPATRFGRIIATHERIKKYTNRDSGTLPNEERMMAFGSDLFETLFTGDVRRLYDEARSRQHGRKLDLVFTSMVPWIAEKPWEFAYDENRRSFLATEDIHFIRNVLTPIPADVIPPREGPLRLLVASAQPAGFGRLSVEQETTVIRRGFQALIDSGAMEIEILARATPSSIHEKLSADSFSIVHFIGHGVFDEKTQQGALVFEDGRGRQSLLGERSVREIFCQRGVRMVFLNSCQSGAGGRADFNKGIAQSLVAHGLPALVANQYSVLDSSASYFAQHFYWSLSQGMSVGQASREARIAVNYSMKGELIDWAVPVLYARDPNMTLAVQSGVGPQAAPTSRRAHGTPGPAARPFEVAVWDIDSAFPALESTLARMNAAQAHFGFHLAELSAPVDAFDVENKAPDGKPYLWAERFTDRLARMPMELDVDLLACVTRHWLRDDDYFNIYGAWPVADGPAVVIFSFAGFDEMAPQGPATDRMLANVMVTALGGYLGAMGTHAKGPKSCPMWRNSARDLEHMGNLHKFDARCRRLLVSRIPVETAALEALLKKFR